MRPQPDPVLPPRLMHLPWRSSTTACRAFSTSSGGAGGVPFVSLLGVVDSASSSSGGFGVGSWASALTRISKVVSTGRYSYAKSAPSAAPPVARSMAVFMRWGRSPLVRSHTTAWWKVRALARSGRDLSVPSPRCFLRVPTSRRISPPHRLLSSSSLKRSSFMCSSNAARMAPLLERPGRIASPSPLRTKAFGCTVRPSSSVMGRTGTSSMPPECSAETTRTRIVMS